MVVLLFGRENGGKGVRATAGHGQQQQQQQSTTVIAVSAADGSEGAGSGGAMQQQQSTPASTSSGGSGSTAPATSVAMWTAISNPLLLISHVLKRSMDLQQAGASEMNVIDIEPPQSASPSPPPLPSPPPSDAAVFCEYVCVEQHAEPPADWSNETMDNNDAAR